MGINLQKGQKLDLSKGGPDGGLRRIMVGLGWDEAPRNAAPFESGQPQPIDCDASAILCGANGKIVGGDYKNNCVFFGNLRHSSGAVVHRGDNLTGEGDGDDEQIMVNLPDVPADVERIVFVVNIYDADKRDQHFGLIENAFIRLADMDTGEEICRFNLTENYTEMTGLVVGELYRKSGVWKFNAIGQPVRNAGRLDAIIRLFI